MLWGYGDSNREIELFEAGAKGVIPGKDSRTGETWWNGTKLDIICESSYLLILTL